MRVQVSKPRICATAATHTHVQRSCYISVRGASDVISTPLFLTITYPGWAKTHQCRKNPRGFFFKTSLSLHSICFRQGASILGEENQKLNLKVLNSRDSCTRVLRCFFLSFLLPVMRKANANLVEAN